MNYSKMHTLVITEWQNDDGSWERDYDIERPGCPEEALMMGPDDMPLMVKNCSVQWEITNAGLDGLDVDWLTLVPGKYRIRAWSQRFSTWGGDEWDAGIELVGQINEHFVGDECDCAKCKLPIIARQ